MKGGITLAIYIAIGLIPVVVGPAGGQSSTHVMTVKPGKSVENVPTTAGLAAIKPWGWPERPRPEASIPDGSKVFTVKPDKVVIVHGQGGVLTEHQALFAQYRTAGNKVELHGPCYSACTVILTYVAAENICIAPGAFMAFHAVRSLERNVRMDDATFDMYLALPAPVRRWIDRSGGWQNLPLNGYWTMYDRELWAMGYPKCQ